MLYENDFAFSSLEIYDEISVQYYNLVTYSLQYIKVNDIPKYLNNFNYLSTGIFVVHKQQAATRENGNIFSTIRIQFYKNNSKKKIVSLKFFSFLTY